MNAAPPQYTTSSSGVLIRAGAMEDLESLADIDVDAATLFGRAGIRPVSTERFSSGKLDRWRRCMSLGGVLVAVDSSGHNVGFAAFEGLDREPYLVQLSVRLASMRQGIGTRLLNNATRLVRESGGQALWLIAYSHLRWNRPFYERNGFVVVPQDECSSEIARELSYERRWLPMAHERVVMCKELAHESCALIMDAASA